MDKFVEQDTVTNMKLLPAPLSLVMLLYDINEKELFSPVLKSLLNFNHYDSLNIYICIYIYVTENFPGYCILSSAIPLPPWTMKVKESSKWRLLFPLWAFLNAAPLVETDMLILETVKYNDSRTSSIRNLSGYVDLCVGGGGGGGGGSIWRHHIGRK